MWLNDDCVMCGNLWMALVIGLLDNWVIIDD